MPKNWSITFLRKIISLTSGVDLNSFEYNSISGNIPYITGASNFLKSGLVVDRFTSKEKCNSYMGEILITCKGTIGKITINTIGNIHIARQIMAIRSFIDSEFMIYYLESIIDEIKNKAKSLIPGIDRNAILNKTIAIAPQNEILRIKNKLNDIYAYLNDLVLITDDSSH